MENLEKILLELIGESDDRSEYQTYPEWEDEKVLVERRVLLSVLEEFKRLRSLSKAKMN